MKLPILVQKVFGLLNSTCDYAVLRNYKGLPYENGSRDIDILVKKSQFTNVRESLANLFESEGYYIATYFESERIYTFVVAKVTEEISILQFDFFFHTSAYGHILMDSGAMLAEKEEENGVYHVRKEFQFLDKYTYLKFIGAKYPEKYQGLLEEVKESDSINRDVQSLFGIESLESLLMMSTADFRTIVKKRNKKYRFSESINNRLSFYYHYLCNWIHPKGYSIGFTGPDGAGKTTVINRIIDNLSVVYSGIAQFHFRPSLFGNLGDVAHSAGIKKEVDHNYNIPHRGKETGILSSLARLLYYSIDYIIGYWLKIRPLLQHRNLVIFDRYYTDTICDARRSRIYLPHSLLYRLGRLFIPSLDYNILLTAPSEVILTRKRELDAESINAINKKIEYLQNKPRYYKILNEGTPDETVSKILNVIFEQQHKKNIKRI